MPCAGGPGLWNLPPAEVRRSGGLMYRDFITVGVLCHDLKLKNGLPVSSRSRQLDSSQEPGVEVGRIQIFNNWSPYRLPIREPPGSA
jgi:hypothetical protein